MKRRHVKQNKFVFICIFSLENILIRNINLKKTRYKKIWRSWKILPSGQIWERCGRSWVLKISQAWWYKRPNRILFCEDRLVERLIHSIEKKTRSHTGNVHKFYSECASASDDNQWTDGQWEEWIIFNNYIL